MLGTGIWMLVFGWCSYLGRTVARASLGFGSTIAAVADAESQRWVDRRASRHGSEALARIIHVLSLALCASEGFEWGSVIFDT